MDLLADIWVIYITYAPWVFIIGAAMLITWVTEW